MRLVVAGPNGGGNDGYFRIRMVVTVVSKTVEFSLTLIAQKE
jgi:hypothetical protein